MTTSQIIRPTFDSPERHGMTTNVSGSGIATISDSSIALKPVIDEPSKPIPSSSAPASSPGVIAKLFRCPSRSLNQRSIDSTPSALHAARTAARDSSLDVALFFDSTCCAMKTLLEMTKAPDAAIAPKTAGPATEAPSPSDGRSIAQ